MAEVDRVELVDDRVVPIDFLKPDSIRSTRLHPNCRVLARNLSRIRTIVAGRALLYQGTVSGRCKDRLPLCGSCQPR